MKKYIYICPAVVFLLFILIISLPYNTPASGGDSESTGAITANTPGTRASGAKQQQVDKMVRAFLENSKGSWRDMNIPSSDGKILYDIILKNNYTRALEIGTSTGHSTVWIAWALSKTGGRLITIEINKRRYRQALENFKKAGLSEYIDARLGDAHALVKELEGPFDFVFCDADKKWYKNYFIDIYPKLEKGGCYTAHNVNDPAARGYFLASGVREFYEHIKSVPGLETTINDTGSGMSISYKN